MALAVLFLAAASGLMAQEPRAEVYKTPDLFGKAVKNRAGEHIGYLEDIVVDLKDGRVAYAVLTTENAVGFGGRMYALPVTAFGMADDIRNLVLDVKKDEFTNVEGFDANRWPARAHERWANLKRGERGTTPDRKEDRPAAADKRDNTEPGKDSTLRRLSSLDAMTVKSAQGENLGSIHGFAVDITNGKIVYAAMSYGGVAGIGSKSFAIPWSALELKALNLQAGDRSFVLNANKTDFENSAGFDRNNWPVQADNRFMKNSDKK
jgi:sporulation protein YlmC with PRC-barrel domain